jgi:hypothetical protein
MALRNNPIRIAFWDKTSASAQTVDAAIRKAKQYLAAWKQQGDTWGQWQFASPAGKRVIGIVVRDSGYEDTDAQALIFTGDDF